VGPESKRFDEPDELLELPLLTQQVVVLGEVEGPARKMNRGA
jgi:hypothetical protein